MVKKGDTIDDVIKYVVFRTKHLRLERQKVPFTVEKLKRGKAGDKLSARILELAHMKKILHEDIKEHGKYEWRKVQYLEKVKIDALKRGDNAISKA